MSVLEKGLFKTDIFIPQTNGNISDSLLQNWTQQALECYTIKCNCSMCSISKHKYSFVCQMPKVINKLLKNGIIPDRELLKADSY